MNNDKEIVEFIQNDKVITKYLCKSGSVPIISAISVWSNHIEIQLSNNTRPNYFNGFIKRINKAFGLKAIFGKSDGSCPNTITILKK